MKVAIYIEHGVTQLVLTPESDWERSVTDKMAPDGTHDLTVYRGSFYECQGGWTRFDTVNQSDRSLILRASPKPIPAPVDEVSL